MLHARTVGWTNNRLTLDSFDFCSLDDEKEKTLEDDATFVPAVDGCCWHFLPDE